MKILVNDVNLYYEVIGKGKPLIMVHGNGENHKIFDKAVEVLKEHYTCYLIDSRNHGLSDKVKKISYNDIANDVICFVNKLEIKDCAFYGFSDGGIVGLLCAMKEPNLFTHLVISGANLNPKGVKKFAVRIIKIMHFITRSINLKLMLDEPNIDANELSKITIPTLVLAGSNDLILQDHTKLIANSIKNSKLNILDNENHGSYIVHSTKIASLLLDFIK
ncbi:MAG: alpha/beta hydrolase [Alphaproteobacteria bacterium]|nr:alpha/beta hydrolase [Alphaproteobacteria bacterium]